LTTMSQLVIRPSSLFPDSDVLKRKLTDLSLLEEQGDAVSAERRKRRKTRRVRNERLTAKAPINTTQFLMSDDNRTSPTSDWNSSESEDEYEQKEFTKEYDQTTETDRYWKMCKSELMKEYLSIEKTVNLTEQKYKNQQKSNRIRHNSKYNSDILEKIQIFQSEILKLNAENLELAEENRRLMAENESSSSDSSSSSSSSDSSEQSSSEDDDSEPEEDKVDDGRRDDTGYESDKSGTLLEVSSST